MRLLSVFLMFFSSNSFSAPTSTFDSTLVGPKVLFIGNSLSGYNNMPDMLKELSIIADKGIYIERVFFYGRSLLEISLTEALSNKLKSKTWDFIILQDSPYRIAYPDSFTQFPITVGIKRIQDQLPNKGTKLVLFMPWAYKDGMAWYKNFTDDYFEMQQKIYDNSIILANNFNLQIAPVGWSWNNVMLDNSSIELFLPDMSHPTEEGSYLTACVIYSLIFNEELNNNEYAAEIPRNSANYLQEVGSLTVLENYDIWTLVTSISEDSKTDHFELMQNYPNPFNSSTIIKYSIPKTEQLNNSSNSLVTLKVYDLLGKEIITLVNNVKPPGFYKVQFNASFLTSGIYFYVLNNKGFSFAKKMILLR